jgi:predicted O-methyltransferase YrrM
MQLQRIEHYWNDPMFEEGYFTYPRLYSFAVSRFPTNSHFVEVGSWKGQSAAYMAVEIHNSGKTIRFDCIDTWKGSLNEDPHQNDQYVKNGLLYEKFMSNVDRVKHIITPRIGDSIELSKTYEDDSLDFVFIDGDHSYEAVKADIQAWLPKVKSNGLLAGHDYGWCESVRKAVHEVLGNGDEEYTDSYGKGFRSYDDPWREGCWMINIESE